MIPFSSFHRMQRTDSAWASAFDVPLDAYAATFASTSGATLLPPFVAVDCAADDVRPLDPRPLTMPMRPPQDFGDDWTDPLARDDLDAAAAYFRAHDGLRERAGFVELQIGGREHRIVLDAERAAGIGIAAPRRSFVTAIRETRFDELLLSHFARVTLHGLASVSPALVPAVSRYGDYAGVRRHEEVVGYLAEYERRTAVALVAATAAAPLD